MGGGSVVVVTTMRATVEVVEPAPVGAPLSTGALSSKANRSGVDPSPASEEQPVIVEVTTVTATATRRAIDGSSRAIDGSRRAIDGSSRGAVSV